jgi:hypothetical protein
VPPPPPPAQRYSCSGLALAGWLVCAARPGVNAGTRARARARLVSAELGLGRRGGHGMPPYGVGGEAGTWGNVVKWLATCPSPSESPPDGQ